MREQSSGQEGGARLARDISEPRVSVYLSICYANLSDEELAFNGRHFHYHKVVSPGMFASSSEALMIVEVNDIAHGRVKRVPAWIPLAAQQSFQRAACAQLAPHQTHSTVPICAQTS